MRKIVISGSMSLFDKMKSIAVQIENMGYVSVLPEEFDWDSVPKDEWSKCKGNLSRRHFEAIAGEDTYAILVINDAKKGVDNYIGASTFAEIAMAFYFHKKIFLLNDIYDPFMDELSGWGAIPIKNDLTLLNSES